jgi:hypothetical protein
LSPLTGVGIIKNISAKIYKDPLRERAQILKELKPDSHRVWLERLSVRLSAHEKNLLVSFACMPFFDENETSLPCSK